MLTPNDAGTLTSTNAPRWTEREVTVLAAARHGFITPKKAEHVLTVEGEYHRGIKQKVVRTRRAVLSRQSRDRHAHNVANAARLAALRAAS